MNYANFLGYGELLLRLSPSIHGELIEQSSQLQMAFAGAEANILCDLSRLGHDTAFLSAFPQNPLGRKAAAFLNSYGVNTSPVSWSAGRIGTYYIEHGRSIRGTSVTYDRQHSTFSQTVVDASYWERALVTRNCLILSGISPALSEICLDNMLVGIEVAQKMEVPIVLDMNYRRSLWTTEAARAFFLKVLPKIDILFANIGAIHDIFGLEVEDWSSLEGISNASHEAIRFVEALGSFQYIAMTIRQQLSASQNVLGGMVKTMGETFVSEFLQTEIVDRLGGGDAFAAAFIHGIFMQWPIEKILNFAVAAFAYTQTIPGDINLATEEELLSIAEGNTLGFAKR